MSAAVGRRQVGVVLPARNEQDSLPACLAALARAAASVRVPVHVAVVLDACTDASAVIVEGARSRSSEMFLLDAVVVNAGNVGAARAAGVAHLLAAHGPADVWLASTDADSTVPPHWLRRQLTYADAGADVVAGTVTVADWGERGPALALLADRSYRMRGADAASARPGQHHDHVHGANLGFTAAAYCAVGGFPALAVHEDVGLVSAFAATGHTIMWATDLPVVTSARRTGRAPAGFASSLNDLEHDLGHDLERDYRRDLEQDPGPDPAAEREAEAAV